MNPHFRKGGKAKQGSGHLWVLADYDKEGQISHSQIQHIQQQNQSTVIQSEGPLEEPNNIPRDTTINGMTNTPTDLSASTHYTSTYKVSNGHKDALHAKPHYFK